MEGGLLSLKWNNHRSSFIHVLSSLRKKDSFCDVTLACDGKFYPSHKLVLSTCSDYFQDMFQQTQCKHPIIVLKDIRCEDLEALLNYMYVGEVNVIQEKLSTLIKAAECLRIKGLAVPDDPPHKDSEKRSSMHHDFSPDSKRRKVESDYHRSKESYRTHKHSKPADLPYRQTSVPVPIPVAVPESSFRSPVHQSDSTKLVSGNYGFDNEKDSTDATKSKEKEDFIKQEPPDNFIDLEDTKEGILPSTQSEFLSPSHRQDDAPNIDHMGASDSQDIWGSESKSEDDYPPLERGENSGPSNEDPLQNEPGWAEGRSSQSWKKRVATVALPCWKPDPTATETAANPSVWPPYFLPGTGADEGQSASESFPGKHECEICYKTFDHKGNYRKHVMTHTGERPFECEICGYSASQKGNLQAHIRRMHPSTLSMIQLLNPRPPH